MSHNSQSTFKEFTLAAGQGELQDGILVKFAATPGQVTKAVQGDSAGLMTVHHKAVAGKQSDFNLCGGSFYVLAGEALAQGDLVVSNADGKAVVAVSPEVGVIQILEPGAAGSRLLARFI